MIGALVLGLQATLLEPAVVDPLHWVAPPECPSSGQVRGAVEHYVARPLGEESVHARALVERTEDGAFRLRLAIEIVGPEGVDGVSVERQLEDPDCRVLADAAALMVAIALDPNAASRATEPVLAVDEVEAQAEAQAEPAPRPEPTPTIPAAREAKSAGTPTDAAAPSRRGAAPRECLPGPSLLRRASGDRFALRPACGAVGLRFGVQLGPLPRFGPGLGGYLAALWPRLRLELAGAHWFEQPARTAADPNVGGDLRLTTGTALACGRLGVLRVEFPLCAGVELGALRGVGVGVDPSEKDTLLWSAFVAHARAGWSPVRRFALSALVGTAVPFTDYRFQITNIGTIHTVAPASLRAALSAEVRFP
jgi:hypothetical protein